MADIGKFMLMLQSPKPSRRYDACEELRVAASLPPDAIAALEKATNDPDPSVRESAASALAVHKPSIASPPQITAAAAPPTSRLAILALALALIGVVPNCLANAYFTAEVMIAGDLAPVVYSPVARTLDQLQPYAALVALSCLILAVVSLIGIHRGRPRIHGRGYAWLAIALSAPPTICMLFYYAALLWNRVGD